MVAFAELNQDLVGNFFLGKPIIDLESVVAMQSASVIICVPQWLPIYDFFYAYKHIRVYVSEMGWKGFKRPCIICGNTDLLAGHAMFADFLIERQFGQKEKATALGHCPHCGFTYSIYRPNDEEMDRLYNGYRDEEYQKQRNKYESNYTKEFNDSLTNPEDGGKKRRDGIIRFIWDYVDMERTSMVLDFGGDRGQFIPEEFINADKYVYDISGVDVLEGRYFISNYQMLRNYSWDFIMCNMVMEHLADVRSYFKELIEIMNSNSILYIEVPNEDYNIQNPITIIHEHINVFRGKTFRVMAELENMEILKLEETDCIRVLMRKIS